MADKSRSLTERGGRREAILISFLFLGGVKLQKMYKVSGKVIITVYFKVKSRRRRKHPFVPFPSKSKSEAERLSHSHGVQSECSNVCVCFFFIFNTKETERKTHG